MVPRLGILPPSLLRDSSVSTMSTCFRCAFSTRTPTQAANNVLGSQDLRHFPRNLANRGGRLTAEDRARMRAEETAAAKAKQLEKNMTRGWKEGDVYAPHDLSPSEMKKWRKRFPPTTDAFDALSMNPLDQYKNFSIMSEYMTEMGRIRHRSVTGLRPVNQRKIAKAIRRAIGLGLMPSVHRHPEVISKEYRDLIAQGKNP